MKCNFSLHSTMPRLLLAFSSLRRRFSATAADQEVHWYQRIITPDIRQSPCPVVGQFTLYLGPSGSTENPSSSGPLSLALSIHQLRRARWKLRMPLRLAMRYSQLRSAIPTIIPKVDPKICWLAQLVNMPTRALIWLEYARKLPGI